MTEIARLSRIRLILLGLFYSFMGSAWLFGPVIGLAIEIRDQGASDMVGPIVALVVLSLLGIPTLLRGLALLQQSSKRDCYFRAGPEGIEIRLGVKGPYGLFVSLIPKIPSRLPASPDTFALRFPGQGAKWDGAGYFYRFSWADIASIENAKFQLFVNLRSGAALSILRDYFSEKPRKITERLRDVMGD